MGSSLKGLRKALNIYFPDTTTGKTEGDQLSENRRLFFEAAHNDTLPFWIWNQEDHIAADIAAQDKAKATGNPYHTCCFNHLIGLPKAQDGITENPIFPFQKIYLDALDKNKMVYCVKATGLGISEVTYRWLCWQVLKSDEFQDSQVIILVGPRIRFAVSAIARMKNFFAPHNIFFNTKETVIELNKCRVEAMPSHHLDAARGLPRVKGVVLDEFAFFYPHEADALQIAERILGKDGSSIYYTHNYPRVPIFGS